MRISEVLELRAWALQALGPDLAPPPPCSSASWRFFVRAERCALPLKARLVAGGLFERLESGPQQELANAARVELQRVLNARGQLLLIDRLAAERGWDVLVLKGGVAALSDRDALDLADVDVLAEPGGAPALAAALDSAGYRGAGASSPLHLEGRIAGAGLKIEVHAGIDMVGCEWSESVWSRATPLVGSARLRCLAPRDHLWHILVHVGVLHPDRRGAIRDLLLLSQALTRCRAGDLVEVTAQIEDHAYAATLRDMLFMARGLRDAAPLEDRFMRQAAVAYCVGWYGRWVPLTEMLRADVGRWAVALLSGQADMRREWGRVRMVTTGVSLSRPIAWLERRAPQLGRGVRVASRVARVVMGMTLGLPLALGAASVAARAKRIESRSVPGDEPRDGRRVEPTAS